MWSLLALSIAFAGTPEEDGSSSTETNTDERAETERAPTVRSEGDERTVRGAPALGLTLGGLYGAYFGGATAGAIFGDDEGGAILAGGLLGAGVGGLAGLTASSKAGIGEGDLLLIGTTTAYGGFLGTQAGRGIIAHGASNEWGRIQAAGVLGSVAGVGVGALLAGGSPDPDAVLRTDLGLASGFLTGTAISDMRGLDVSDDRQQRAAISVLSTTALGGVAWGLGAADLSQPGVNATALGLAQGTWIGLWTPTVVRSDSDVEDAWAGARLGAGTGFLLSYGIAALGEPDTTSLALQGGGILAGNAVGAGLPLLLAGEDSESSVVVGSMLAGGVLGQIGGAALAPRYEASDDDVFFMGALGLWTGWQSLGWGVVAGYNDPAQGLGGALTLAGAGGLAAVALAPAVEFTPAETSLMLSAGTWGSGLSALTGVAAGADPRGNLAASLGVGDAAMLGTALALSGDRDASWGTVARVNGGLAEGGALGGLGVVILGPDEIAPGTAAAATVIGSGLGLTGALLLPGRSREHAALSLPGLKVPALPAQASWSVAPWQGEDGSQGAYVGVKGQIN